MLTIAAFACGLLAGWITLSIALVIRQDIQRHRREFPSLADYRRGK